MYFREPGRSVVLLRASDPGDATDAELELGSSEYAKEILGAVWGAPPSLEIEHEAALQRCLVEIIQNRLADSAHDCSDGGISVTLAESAFQRGIGAQITLPSHHLPVECVLFGEDASRVVISCDPRNVDRIREFAAKHDIAADVIGETLTGQLTIAVDGKTVVSGEVADLRAAYEGALEKALRADPVGVAAD
jgi:phosphoribosylformylglycinamidine synthase